MNSESGKLDKEVWLRIMNSTNWKCFYCGMSLDKSKKNRTIDHIVPINCGGKNEERNCVPACISCNCSKQDFVVNKWYKFETLTDEKKTYLLKVLEDMLVNKE